MSTKQVISLLGNTVLIAIMEVCAVWVIVALCTMTVSMKALVSGQPGFQI
jgi:hypothetical protein